ncbi:fragile X mental retardation gene 1, autosomal homolog, isoform CRA_c [Mus musculus]|nr:fragile X mental retardation gene 1, autosomal homolog, isoform CRA_c [Mus musculus]
MMKGEVSDCFPRRHLNSELLCPSPPIDRVNPLLTHSCIVNFNFVYCQTPRILFSRIPQGYNYKGSCL